MTCSPARLAANRRNALKSTGPKTPEGKASSRLNAVRHAMAGAGDLLAPGEDAALVAQRAVLFAQELGATCVVSRMLAQRAALLSVRMERASERDLVAVAAEEAEARDRFDRDRYEASERLIAALDGPDPAPALDQLEASPEGVQHLTDAWTDLCAGLRSADPGRVEAARRRVIGWLARGGSTEPAPTSAGLIERVEAELARLRLRNRPMDEVARVTDRQRDEAGLLARFNPSPEAVLARRYEAAAERGMYRAFRAIAEIRRAREGDPAAVARSLGLPVPPTPVLSALAPAPAPAPALVPPPPVRPEPAGPSDRFLGSFRLATPDPDLAACPVAVERFDPLLDLIPPRKPRPDLRKLAAGRR